MKLKSLITILVMSALIATFGCELEEVKEKSSPKAPEELVGTWTDGSRVLILNSDFSGNYDGSDGKWLLDDEFASTGYLGEIVFTTTYDVIEYFDVFQNGDVITIDGDLFLEDTTTNGGQGDEGDGGDAPIAVENINVTKSSISGYDITWDKFAGENKGGYLIYVNDVETSGMGIPNTGLIEKVRSISNGDVVRVDAVDLEDNVVGTGSYTVAGL